MADERMVDSRIVEMQFDGKDFDKGIKKSQKTLEEFKKCLDFSDAAKQMEAVSSSGPLGNAISSIAANVKKLTKEFTGIGSIAVYVAQKIKKAWQGALDSVHGFLKSMTSAQVDVGREKYDKLLKSVQTIMNATGDSEEVVYAAMEKLNHYTDETSYNFADMAQNIGKFTTAGVALGDAEAEMEGIANWAALAGQGVNEAQRAMYNISQAMSAGYMLKIDYKSIQNANMDIRKFRQEALDAAVAAGTLKKSADGIYKTVKGGKQVDLDNFVETLQYKWFDKKTMETVFKTFADNEKGIGKEAYKAAQRCFTLNDAIGAWKDMLSTGWMTTYEHIFGKAGEAMALFSGLCNKVSESLATLVDFRNDIFGKWKANGGRDSLWGALFGELKTPDDETLFAGAYGLLDAIRDIGNAIHEAVFDFIGNFIDPINKGLFEADKESYGTSFIAAGIANLTQKIQEFTNTIQTFLHSTGEGQTESRLDRIKNVAMGVFSVVTLIVDIIKGIGSFVGEILGQLSPAFSFIGQLLSYLSKLFTGKVAEGVRNNTIGNFFHNLAEALKPFTAIINLAVGVLAKFIARIASWLAQSGLLKTLGTIIQYVGMVIAKVIGKIVDSGVFQEIFSWIQQAIAKIPSLVARIKELVKSFKAGEKLKSIKDFFGRLFGGKSAVEVLRTIKDAIVKIVKKIPEIFKGKGGVFSSITGFFSSILSSLFGGTAKAEDAEPVAEELATAIAKPIEELGKGDVVAKVIEKAKPGFLDTFKSKLTEFWGSITDFFKNIGNSEFVQKVKTFFSGIDFKTLLVNGKDILKWLAIFRGGSGLVSIGKGIKKLGTGIKVFGKNLKKLDLKNLFSNMFNISNVINSNNTDNSKRFDFGKFGTQLLMIAGAIAIVVQAASHLAKMKPAELQQAGIALGVVIGGLLAAAFLAKKFAGNGKDLLGLAVAAWLLTSVLGSFQKMEWGPLLDGVLKLGVVLAALAGAGRLAGNVKMKGFISLAAAIILLMVPIKAFMKMSLLNENGGFGKSLAQGLAIVSGLILLMGLAAKLSGGNKMSGMISMAVAMTVLLIPIKAIAAMEFGKAAQGVLAIIGLMGMITYMIKQTDDKAASKLSGIVGAIVLLSGVAAIIAGTMDWKQALIGFGPIILMIGSMALLLAAAKSLTPQKIKGLSQIFTTFAIVVLAIAGTIAVISILDVDTTKLAVFLGGVILMIAMFGVMCKLIGSANSKAVANIGIVFGTFTAVVLALGGSLVAMAMYNVDWSLVISFMTGISLMLVAVGAMIKMAFKTNSKGITKAAVVLLAVGALVAIVGGSLALMSHFKVDWGMILAFTVGLSVLIGALAFALPVLSKISLGGAIKGIGIIAAAVVAIGGAMAIIIPVIMGSVGNALSALSAKLKLMSGMLVDFFGRMGSISDGSVQRAVTVLDGIKDILLKFIGIGNHESDIRSFLSQLNYIGAGLDAFFVNEAKYPDPESSKSFKVLNKIMEMSPAIAAMDVGSAPQQLLYLGAGLMLFDEATKDITTSEPVALSLLQGLFGQVENIKEFAKLPIDEFSGQMTALGGAMSLYAKGAKEVTGIDVENGEVPDITDSITILKAICKSISGEDGTDPFTIPDNMPDDTKLGLFAGQLEALGNALSTFATAAKDMETDTSKALALLTFLAEIGGYITPDNLAVVDAFGDDMHVGSDGTGGKLGQFALDIGALGTALSSFAENIGGNEASFTTGLGVLDHFQELNQKLTADNLKFTKAFSKAGVHKTSLDTLATDIGALGHALAAFASNVTMDDGTEHDFDHALGALDFLVKMQVKLSSIKLDGILQWFEGNSATLGTLATDVEELGSSLRDFSQAVTGELDGVKNFDGESVLYVMDVLGKMLGILNLINLGHAGEWNGLTDKAYELTQFFAILFDESNGNTGFMDGSFIAAFAKFAQDLSTVFNETEGIDPSAVAVFQQLVDAVSTLISTDYSEKFEYPGQMISEGIATGIEKGRSRVVQAIIDVVNAGITAGNETAGIASPSKVFAEMGQYFDLGLIKGIENKSDKVENAARDMTQTALDQAGLTMASISSAMADTMDLQPTITPVLDLSNVTGAQGILDNLFSGYSLNLGGVLDKAAAATTRNGPAEVYVQNPTDLSGVQSSISALQADIVGLQSAISNMKIVLNTGVVAGGVADGVDEKLGMNQFYASRRN